MRPGRPPLALRHVARAIHERCGVELREWVLARHSADPDLTIDALGAELGVPRDTWRRWLRDWLELVPGAGPRLVDRRQKAV
jgi:hypothetical protein